MAFPVSEYLIVTAESALGRRFPDALRLRLAASNGGDIATADDDWTLHPVRDAADHKRLSRTANDIVHETALARQWPNFPIDGIAVAANGAGDLLILVPGSGELHLWDHETGAIDVAAVNWD
jgi:hypothetical protein